MEITAVDALAMLRYLVGLDDEVICPEFATIEQTTSTSTTSTSTTILDDELYW